MNATRIVGACAVLALVGACGGSSTVAPDPDEFEWQAEVFGTTGWEHLAGEAAFRWTEGTQTIRAGIALEGDEPGAVRPWHVHHDSCASGGGIVGLDQQYPRLEIDEDGSASVVVDVPIGVDPSGAFHVNVHLSDAELAVIVACGDFSLVGTEPGGPGTPGAPPNIPGY
jgi:superoxide dismutase, Cu-Zn family